MILNGTWVGQGKGQYPTIESFSYQEQVRYEFDSSYPLFHFEQKTMLMPTNEPSHWESGFIRVLDNGLIEISSAQDSGRVEVLQGKIDPSETPEDSLRMELNSVALAHDDRLVQTKRVYVVTNGTLTYQKFMATNTTDRPRLILHLEASLKRLVSEYS